MSMYFGYNVDYIQKFRTITYIIKKKIRNIYLKTRQIPIKNPGPTGINGAI